MYHRTTLPRIRNHKKNTNKFETIPESILNLEDNFPEILFRLQIKPIQRFQFVNQSVQNITGYSPEDFYSNPKIILSIVLPEYHDLISKCLSGHISSPVTIRIRRKDGAYAWLETRFSLIRTNSGLISGVEGLARDITDRKNFENKAVEDSKTILNQLTSLGKFVNNSSSFSEIVRIIGRTIKELTGADQIIVMAPLNDSGISCLWSDCFDEAFLPIALDHMQHKMSHPDQKPFHPLFITDINEAAKRLNGRCHLPPTGVNSAIICLLGVNNKLNATVACLFIKPQFWNEQTRSAIETYCLQSSIALENAQLQQQLEDSYIETINALSKAIDVRDAYTSSHSHQLVDWAEATARRIGCSEVEIDDIHWATLLHDIGKIGIPDNILLKPNKLSEDEWTRMRKHPEIGSTIVASIHRLSGVIPIIRCHHEHYDGEGYPEGLKQEEIPLGARILSVVDAYGAMVSERVYRKPLDSQTAVKELQNCAGTQFDPQVVKTFVSLLPEFTDNYCYTS